MESGHVRLNQVLSAPETKSLMAELAGHIIDDGKQRNTNDHAGNPPHAAKENNGKGDPEAGETGGVAENFRADDIPVHLLQNDDKNKEHQAVDRFFKEQDQQTRNGTDERTEKRDDVGDSHHHGNQRGGAESHRDAAQEAENADDRAVQQLSHKEAVEHLIRKADLPFNPVRPFG